MLVTLSQLGFQKSNHETYTGGFVQQPQHSTWKGERGGEKKSEIISLQKCVQSQIVLKITFLILMKGTPAQ